MVKPLHVHGFFKTFKKIAQHQNLLLSNISQYELPIIGIEPSTTLAYRDEYQKLLGKNAPNVLLIQEWLAKNINFAELETFSIKNTSEPRHYQLLAHCTEASNAAAAVKDWVSIFKKCGIHLKVENAGCCGMAGTFGHETTNYQTSETIYQLAWAKKVKEVPDALLLTGYSCRTQVKRMVWN